MRGGGFEPPQPGKWLSVLWGPTFEENSGAEQEAEHLSKSIRRFRTGGVSERRGRVDAFALGFLRCTETCGPVFPGTGKRRRPPQPNTSIGDADDDAEPDGTTKKGILHSRLNRGRAFITSLLREETDRIWRLTLFSGRGSCHSTTVRLRKNPGQDQRGGALTTFKTHGESS